MTQVSRRLWRSGLVQLETLGNAVIALWVLLLDALFLLVNGFSVTVLFRRGRAHYFWSILVQQMYFTAVQALPLVLLVGGALGVLAMLPMLSFGVTELDLLATILNVVLIDQVAPFFLALIVIGRSGTAITAELGGLHLNRAIDSLIAMGIEPDQLLILPRFVGLALAMLVLMLWIDVAVVVAAGVYAMILEGISLGAFLKASLGKLDLQGAVINAAMVVTYSAVIVALHVQFALRVHDNTDIPRNLPRAFVSSLVTCMLITLLFGVARSG